MPSFSPRTQSMQMAAGAGVDQATALFERGLSDQAYSLLLAKLPELATDVCTFKVLDTDLDHGMGVGAFVVLRHDQPLYIPICMVENALKPLELVYHKALDLFVPLSKAWLDELDKTALSSLGKGVKTPETLYGDVDIRNIVLPPRTGRFSYAAWEPVVLADVARVLDRDALEKLASEPHMLLLEFLDRAPNAVKVAFAAVLKKRPRLLKHASFLYGVKPLLQSLTPRLEKVAGDPAAAKQQYGGGLWIADQGTTPAEFRRIFGEKAAEAYANVRRNGYAAKDERRRHNRAVVEQPYRHCTEPRQPGLYLLYGTDGRPRQAFVMPNPIDLMADSPRYGRRPITPGQTPPPDRVYPYGRPSESPQRRTQPEFLAVLEGGDYLQLPHLVAQGNPADEIADGKLPDAVFKDRAGAPRQGLGFFVRRQGSTFQATAPLEIKSVTTDSEGTRRLRVSSPAGFHEKQVFTEAAHPHGNLWMPQGQNLVYLPRDFVWVPLKTRLEGGEVFTTPHDLSSWAMSMLPAVGAQKVALLSAGAGQFSIGGARALGRVPALKKVAQEYELPVETVHVLLDKAASERRVEFWVTSTEKLARAQLLLTKQAASADASKRKPKADSGEGRAQGRDESQDLDADPMGDPAMDPQAAAMMAASSTPPTPSPSDLAALEMQQAIEQEMQKLQEKTQMLAALTQRTQEIAGGAPVPPMVQTQALGAPPPSQNLATGAPAGSLAAPPMAGMGASMSGAPGAAMPGMDPSMMGAAPGSALPMAPADPFNDPSMGAGAPPPMAMMGPDGPSAEALESQINPQFLEQAAALASGDVFDAAALSSLAQSPAVKELVGQYLPNLEKALDNLGRVLLSIWMQEPTLRGEVGEAAFADLEDNLQSTFKNLGDLVLKLSQSAHALRGPNERADA
jgi:hypothetical protein